MATALFAALASTSVSATELVFDYGSDFQASTSSYGTFVQNPVAGGLAGLQLGASVELNSALELGTSVNFVQGTPDTERYAAVGAASTFSVLIVGEGATTAITGTDGGLTVELDDGPTAKPTGLSNFAGLTIQNSGTLTMAASAATSLVTVSMDASDAASGLVGLNLFGMVLNQKATYTGASSGDGDSLTITSSGANATGLSVGAGAAYNGYSLTAEVAAQATGGTADTVISSVGAAVIGGTLSINGSGTTKIESTVNTLTGFKGSAAAYGVQLGGDKTDVTVGNGSAGSVASTVTSEDGESGSVIVGSGKSATAYGVYALSEGVATKESPALTVTIQTAQGTGDISATVGGSEVQANNINASAYGIYASGVNLNITSTAASSGISANVGSEEGTENTVAVTQTAAGLYANDSIVTIAGGSTKTQFTASVTNTIGSKVEATVSAYGALVNNSTLNLTGKIEFGASLASTVKEDEDGNLPTGYTLNGINATNSIFNVTGGAAAANATEITFNNDSVFEGGEINVTGAVGQTTNAGGAATFQGLTNMDFEATGTSINIQTGATAENDTGVGGDATFKVQGTGNFELTGGEINITASAMGKGTTAGTASLQVADGKFTVSSTDITLTGGQAATTGAIAGSAASIQLGGAAEITGGIITLEGGNADAGTGAGGAATIKLGTTATLTDGKYILTGGTGSSTGTGGAATITLGSGLTTLSGGTYTLTGGDSGGTTGGNATIQSSAPGSALTLINGAQIELVGGAKTGGTGNGGTASIDLTQGSGAGALTLGTEDGQNDGSSITIGNGGSLILSAGGGTAYDGTTITVGVGGTLNTGSGTGLAIKEGATLVLTKGAASVSGTGASTIAGTLYINGTSEQTETEGTGPYDSGFGKMTISGDVLTEDSALYVSLKENDLVTFDAGSSMDAAQVDVGVISGTTSTAKLTIAGGSVNIGQLNIGGTGQGAVELTGGILTLGAPELNEDGTYTSALDISTGSTFTVAEGDGILITDSYNLWNQNPAEATSDPLTPNTGDVAFAHTGGYIELTNPKVDLAWLAQAKTAAAGSKLIIDGTLYQNKNGAEVAVNVYPQAPANDGQLPTNGVTVGEVGDMLLGVALNAQTLTPPKQTGNKPVTYQNLVIGSVPSSLPWGTQGTNTVWNLSSTDDTQVGFQKIMLGDGDSILVTSGQTLILTGDGENIVSANNTVNLYVGTQEIAGQQPGQGNLILGYTTSEVAKGGALDGNIYVYNGNMTVNYHDYTVTGNLTLGQAQGKTEAGKTISPTQGSLGISQGSLTVGSIAGNNVQQISLSNGASLDVAQGMTVTMPNANGGITLSKSELTVGQNLIVGTSVATSTVDLDATDSQISVIGDFAATNTNIKLDGTPLNVQGNFVQAPSASKTPNELTLSITGEGDTTVTVGGNFTTNATSVSVVDSAIEVVGEMTIGAPEATPALTTDLVLDGAKLQAASINLNSVNGLTDKAGITPQEATINTNGALTLKNTDVELDAGKVNAASLSVDKDSTLYLGMSAATFKALNTNLEDLDQAAISDPMVVTAQIGNATLAGLMTIQGVGTTEAEQTEVAIQSLDFPQGEDDVGNVVVTGDSALMIGSNSIEYMTQVLPVIDTYFEDTTFTNYLLLGQTINMGESNGFNIGPAATAATGVNIGATTVVAVDVKNLVEQNAANAATTRAVGDKSIALFNYIGEAGSAPAVNIAPTSCFLIDRPMGDMQIKIAPNFDNSALQELTPGQFATTNLLYDLSWVPVDPTTGEVSPTLVVGINEERVRGDLNSLASNSILEASQVIGYGENEGANNLLGIISEIRTLDDYAIAREKINHLALRGAAAHAHEIGISAASMVVDSVWDHGSKLAAAPHEEAKGDLWITLDWNHSRANDYKAGGLDNGYKLDLYGATFGADYDFANGLAAGLAVSVGGGEAKSKGFNDGQKTDVTYWGINLYGTYASPIVNVIGNVGYIGIKNKTKVNGDKGRPDANIWTIGVKAEKDFAINEQFTVTPHVGIRYLSVDVDDFNLQGFHYGTDKANLVQFPIGVAFAANLKTANGAAVKPFLDLSFVPTAGDKNVDNTFGITGGSARDVIDTTIASGAMFQGKIGVNASYGAHNFGLNFAIGGGNKGRLDTGLQAKYRFVF